MDGFFEHVLRAVTVTPADARITSDELSKALGFDKTRQSEAIRQRLTRIGILDCRPGYKGGYSVSAEAHGADVRWLWLMVYGPYLPWAKPLADKWADMQPADVLAQLENAP